MFATSVVWPGSQITVAHANFERFYVLYKKSCTDIGVKDKFIFKYLNIELELLIRWLEWAFLW